MGPILNPLGNAHYTTSADVAEHQARNSPEKGWHHLYGVDMKVPKGTPVIAVTDGFISPQGWGFGPPNDNKPNHAGLKLHLVPKDKSNVFYYAHLQNFAPGIRPGVWVTAGSIIGYTGTASNVEHLHFASRNGDTDYIIEHALKINPSADDSNNLYSDPDYPQMSIDTTEHSTNTGPETMMSIDGHDGPMSIDYGAQDNSNPISQTFDPADLNYSPMNVNFTPGGFTEHGEGVQNFSVPDFGQGDMYKAPDDMGAHPSMDFGTHMGDGLNNPHTGDNSGFIGEDHHVNPGFGGDMGEHIPPPQPDL
jgi:murein DD-endopeptidase MepM/ murein hydrolase activator NlpD